jgi:hypothetical protein
MPGLYAMDAEKDVSMCKQRFPLITRTLTDANARAEHVLLRAYATMSVAFGIELEMLWMAKQNRREIPACRSRLNSQLCKYTT